MDIYLRPLVTFKPLHGRVIKYYYIIALSQKLSTPEIILHLVYHLLIKWDRDNNKLL